jgi:hypothetical protein
MKEHSARGHREIMRDEMVVRDRIVSLLRDGPRTVPQIAEALGFASYEVVYWVMAMWRYGAVIPSREPDAEGYYRYQLPHGDPMCQEQE